MHEQQTIWMWGGEINLQTKSNSNTNMYDHDQHNMDFVFPGTWRDGSNQTKVGRRQCGWRGTATYGTCKMAVSTRTARIQTRIRTTATSARLGLLLLFMFEKKFNYTYIMLNIFQYFYSLQAFIT